jgi:tetratricopeptide (TPR) repeat protein
VLAEMLRRVAEAPARDRPGLKAAFEAMAAGDSLLAEDMFEREVEASERLIAAASQLLAAEQGKKAEAAKNVAQLALMRGDLIKSVRFFELALAAVPGDLDVAMQLGYAWIAQGSLQKAGDTFSDVITRARELQEERLEAWGHNGQGDVRMAQGDGPGALAAYEAALAIREGLSQRDPANTQWQRDLSVSHERIGDVRVSQGDGPGALTAHEAALAIAEGLAQRDPANTQWQVDVVVSCWKLGSLDALLPIPDRRELLQRGRQILTTLKDAGRLQANQDWIGAFDQALADLA